MNESELTPAEDKKFDHMTDVDMMTVDEAWEVIRREREDAVGAHAVTEVLTQQESPKKYRRYSHRGGRSFPEPSDSSLDPYWNGQAEVAPVEDQRASREAFDHLVEDVDEAAAISISALKEIPLEHAVAVRKAQKAKHQRL